MKMSFAPCTLNVGSESLDYTLTGIKSGLASAAASILGAKILSTCLVWARNDKVILLEARSAHAYVDIKYFISLASIMQKIEKRRKG